MFTPFLNLAPLSSSLNCVKKDNWKLQTRLVPFPNCRSQQLANQRMILLVGRSPLDPLKTRGVGAIGTT